MSNARREDRDRTTLGMFYLNFDRAGKSSFYKSVNTSTRNGVLCACAKALGSIYIAMGGECFFVFICGLKIGEKGLSRDLVQYLAHSVCV